MTYFEHELKMIFGESENLSADTIFSGKSMVSDIGGDLRAKVRFISTGIANQYNGLRLSIINRQQGEIDCETFLFRDIVGLKNGYDPHIWENDGEAKWYGFRPTMQEYEKIQSKVEEYIGMYSEQEFTHGGGYTMGM